MSVGPWVRPSVRMSRALWSKTAKNTDWSTGPIACPLARSLARLTHSLAPNCSLRSRPPLPPTATATTTDFRGGRGAVVVVGDLLKKDSDSERLRPIPVVP